MQFHAKATQDGGGSGLGLWISKKIMDLHDGGISVTSEGEGRGSTFKICLPTVASIDSVECQVPHEMHGKELLYSTLPLIAFVEDTL